MKINKVILLPHISDITPPKKAPTTFVVGNIAAIGGLKEIKSGETLIEPQYLDEMIAFENVQYVSTPVITVSVEPEYLKDFDSLKKIIQA